MKISLNWLRDFVEAPSDPGELKTRLTMLGLSVESFASDGDDWILEAEVTTNRPDCLSHYGIAREIATAYRKPLQPLHVPVKESGPAASGEIGIEILDSDLCARYCGRVIRNVEVKVSPEWLAHRLRAVGQRPINNVADVTNYVLMELGHPLHAFDLSRLAGRRIVVRRASSGETLKTLDGMARALRAENLVIADAERPVALAGVIGGEDSAITSATRSILLESAWFDPVSIRRTSKAHGLHTEASHRFERGADIEMAPLALDRAAELIHKLAGGEILQGLVDVYPKILRRSSIDLQRTEILRVLGAQIEEEQIERILSALGFSIERNTSEGWSVTPPSFRLDVTRPVDLIEEVARHFGYDRLPARLASAPPRIERDTLREKETAIAQLLVSLGYREIITSPLVSEAENSRFSGEMPVKVANPLSQEAAVLRTTSLPAMVSALGWNLDRGRGDLRFFEFGKVYRISPNQSAQERRTLTLSLTGNRRSASVHDQAKELDFFDLKGDLERLWEIFDLSPVPFKSGGGDAYESGAWGRFLIGETMLASFGQLAAQAAPASRLRQPVFVGEVDLEALLDSALRSKSFRPYPKFPAAERDLSLLVPHDVSYQRIAEILRSLGLPDL
ncbi:MAG: phenylalanine--tRNA ligase subunit beta, partial [Terriglobia bacterium]